MDGGVVDVGNSVGTGVVGSGVGVNVGVDVLVFVGVSGMGVSVGVCVSVGVDVSVGIGVSVGMVGVIVGGAAVDVAVGSTGVRVTDGAGDGDGVIEGVALGRMGVTFGTCSFCPARMVVEVPMQLAICNWATLTP